MEYVQLNLEPFSLKSLDVEMMLDGKRVATLTPPAGKFVTSTLIWSVGAGNHLLSLNARCNQALCGPNDVAIYWLKLDHLTPPAATKQVGWRATEWRGDAIDSPLRVQGASGVQFDGVNLYRKTSGAVQISWQQRSALSLNFETFTDRLQSHLVRVTASNKTIYQKSVPAGIFFNHQVDLKHYPDLQEVTLTLTCNARACLEDHLYFPRLLVSDFTPGQGPGANLPLAVGLVALLLVGFVWWFRLLRRPSSRLTG